MALRDGVSFLIRLLERFRRSEHGNIAVIFVITLVPLIAFMGAAVDYSLVSRARTSMQGALDSAALMVAKDAVANNLTATQITQEAQAFFTGMYNHPEVTNVSITASYTASGASTLVLTGSGSMPTNFMKVVGFPTMSFSLSSTAVLGGTTKLQVALVLDNTGSMTQTDSGGTSKISALKTASHNLLSTLQADAQTPGDIQVAIIPFNNFVKVDPAVYKSKPWISWGLQSGNGGGGDGGDDGGGCNGGDGGDDGGGDPCNPSTSNWKGCFTDRNQSYDVQNTAPTVSVLNSYFPAVNCSLAQVRPLSNNWTALNSTIDSMVAAGTTNQPIGLVWGWHALTASDPLNAPVPPAGTKQILILLTDGLNTQNRWTTNQSSIDAREQLVCTNMKAAGITIYTILVMSGNSSILQSCASDAGKYFVLTTANQIIATFQSIGVGLTKLRIAR
jgi:Flp pilus assembly protein TadG